MFIYDNYDQLAERIREIVVSFGEITIENGNTVSGQFYYRDKWFYFFAEIRQTRVNLYVTLPFSIADLDGEEKRHQLFALCYDAAKSGFYNMNIEFNKERGDIITERFALSNATFDDERFADYIEKFISVAKRAYDEHCFLR